MYQILSRSDDTFCLIDHRKLEIFTVDKDELWRMVVEDGAEIRGLSKEDVDFKSRRFVCATSRCNWAEGENIFKKAKRMNVGDDDRFTIVSGGRNFNGAVNRSFPSVVVLEFTFGVQVPIWHEDFDSLMSGERDRVISTLERLSTEVTDMPGLEERYLSAKESGDSESIDSAIKDLVYRGLWPI